MKDRIDVGDIVTVNLDLAQQTYHDMEVILVPDSGGIWIFKNKHGIHYIPACQAVIRKDFPVDPENIPF